MDSGHGLYADVAHLAGGGWGVVWHGDGTQAKEIFGRLLGTNGAPTGPVFQVNKTTNGDDRWPEVAALASGGFVVVWNKGTDQQYVQRFGADAVKAGTETLVASPAGAGDVASFPGGSYLVTWVVSGSVKGRVFSDDGVATTPLFQLTAAGGHGDIAALASESFALVHTPATPAFLVADNKGVVTGPTGALSTTVQTYSLPAVAALSSDSFAAVWQGWNHIYLRRIGADGPIGNQQLQVNLLPGQKAYAAIGGFDDGSFVVVWHSDVPNGCQQCRVYAQRYDADGQRIYH